MVEKILLRFLQEINATINNSSNLANITTLKNTTISNDTTMGTAEDTVPEDNSLNMIILFFSFIALVFSKNII